MERNTTNVVSSGMRAISTRDAAALLEIVHEGAADTGDEPFPSSVLSGLARLIPSDAFVGSERADVHERARVVSVYLERSGKNYTERELTLLSLLRPHLVRMRANASSRRRLTGLRGLTPREAEVLGWIARGRTNAEIARVLFISPHTVRKHVENIFEKLGVRTRTAAAASARALPVGTRAQDAGRGGVPPGSGAARAKRRASTPH
jgi:DNA-binding CsgD family transcriptional regulator